MEIEKRIKDFKKKMIEIDEIVESLDDGLVAFQEAKDLLEAGLEDIIASTFNRFMIRK